MNSKVGDKEELPNKKTSFFQAVVSTDMDIDYEQVSLSYRIHILELKSSFGNQLLPLFFW